MKFRKIILTISLFISLISCASIDLSVSSINRPNTNINNSVFVIPSNKNIDINDLIFQEFLSDIKIALETNGYTVTSNPEEADQVVLLEYGISDPQTNTVLVPQIGKTKIDSTNTTGLLTPGTNTTTYSGTTTYNYEYGITGYVPRQETVYTRVLILTSYDWKLFSTTEKAIQLWKTDVISTGSSSDLREVFPYMVLASENYLGSNTGKKIKITINKSDTRVVKYQNN